ncbi:amidohydrolase [Bacillus pakistanensis]|uniref:Amidohydrolase n=1 Tax=Rossellomorea pakistanensis TaxID=992288 RepID=A0ABS2N6X4_9BACI|nr:amidohydrolase [Bacillus pakistanensis]MBM7583607.1 amidohydrolase [Bacillus pakistanensis]
MIETVKMEELVDEVKSTVIQWRRYLHQNPELSFQEEKTSQFVYETLESFGNLIVSRPTRTSVVARLIGEKPGRVLAMRADMDALPIKEENDFSFVSANPGVMHACGHDGHTAMLLGAAKVLSQLKEQLNGEVRFIFQHAEEVPPGGAIEMVNAGVLKGVDQVIGLHLASPFETGKIGIGYGPVSANCDVFNITINGKGGHSSQPDTAIDPVTISSQVVNNLQHIVSRNIATREKVVISVTQIHGGSAQNIIPQNVKLNGTVRSFDQEVRKEIPSLMERIIKGITEAHGATYNFDYEFGYDSVVNDEDLTTKLEEMVEDVFGPDFILNLEPGAMMGSEDFSAFSKEVPGCFLLVAAGNEQEGIVYPHHHPRFTVDEEALEHGLKILVNAPFKLNVNP